MKTLEELKAENTAAEEETEATPQVEEEETETAEEVIETDDSGQIAESEQEKTEEETSDAWMQSGEQTPQETSAEKTFTGGDIKAAKNKLRSKLEKRHDSELSELKDKISQLENQRGQTGEQLQPRPKLEDFDYDDGAYNTALEKWDDARLDAKIKKLSSGQQHETQRQQAAEAFIIAVDQHYERAAKLTEESGITAEVYKQADLAVRSAIEQAMPNQGDLVTEQLISKIGDGSEKVLYYLGRNQNELNVLQGALLADPSGMKAVLLLGKISNKISSPQKRTSRASKPATQLKGDETPATVNSSGLLKKYTESHKKGDTQGAYNTKQEARKLGIDTSQWS